MEVIEVIDFPRLRPSAIMYILIISIYGQKLNYRNHYGVSSV